MGLNKKVRAAQAKVPDQETKEAICYCELCEALEALEIEISEESSTSVPVADHSKKPVNRKKRRSRKKKSKRKNAEKVDDTVLILIIQDPSPIKVQREKWRLTLPPIPELAEPSSTECSLDTTASFLPDTDMRDDEAKKEIVGLQDARQLNLDAVQKPSPDSLQVLKDALHSAVRDGFGIPFLEEVDPGPLPPPTRLSSERRSLLLNKSTSASEFKPYHKNQPPTKTLRSTARDGFGIPFLEEVDPGPLPPPTPLSSERRSLLLNKSTSASEFKPYHKNKPPPKTLRSTARDGFGIPFLEEVDPGPLPPPTPLSSERRSLLLNKSTSASEFKPYHKNKPPPKNSNTRLAFSNSADSKAKPVDENGNALSCVRVDSNCLDRKKQRRVKTKNDRNTISLKIDEIEGFRGEADIDTLMEYIESPSLDSNKNKARSNQPNNPRTSVKVRAKEEEPRSTKKRREKFKRSNSLEEVSKTKLEDLTEHTSSEKIKSSLPIQKKPLTVEDTDVWQRSSWNKDEDHLLQEPKKMSSERISPELLQESEFLIVTKKQRKKKRRVVCSSRSTSKTTYYSRESGSGRLLYQYQNDQGTSQPRRKSASSVPPSDKSDSSDLDSVHSLPVSSSTRQRVMKNSVSGGSTPQASYADIARSAAGLPSDSCVINVVTYTDSDIRTSVIPILSLPSPAASKKDATTETCDTFLTTEDYPPLDNRNVDFCTDISKFPLSGTKDKSRKQPVIVRDNERPAVILMNDRAEAQISEIKFGFDINYQLLESEAKCNKSRNTAYTLVDQTAPAPTQNVAEFFCRFPSDDNVVHYLTSSWEEVLDKLQSGKASYYDGQ
ncbi:uncharacterized protein LOC128997777 isoform X2 [Macrosteles quadrilineatus]|uniref:uncharacterized protein LOC128997777 isoform X2 n=1 Tax=Macrosteles quadrilineatus TaxID=74068 RepID=UPI0023E2E5D0|nr:uncharacterized protein LOC128997777 isoform X2 [Macrosteles quadrilineatus]